MSDESNAQAGGCLCGAIRFTIDRDAIAGQSHCHCRDCQITGGSACSPRLILPRSAVRPLDMNMEEAMRFTLTAGVTGAAAHPDKHDD